MEFPTVALIDKLLGTCRKYFSVDLIDTADGIGELVGGWTVYGIAVLLFILGIIAGIRANDVGAIILGLLMLPIGVILHYVAIKMLGAENRLVQSTPTSMHAGGILYVIAVAAGVIGVIGVPVTIVYGIIEAIRGDYSALVLIVVAVFLVYLAALALNPKRIAVNDAGETTIGQEAIGLATFILKSVYKFVPVLFGVGAVVVAIMTIIFLVRMFEAPADVAPFIFQFAVRMFIILCLTPLIAYGLFLLYYVVIDVIRALLSLGGSVKSAQQAAGGGGSGGSGSSGKSSGGSGKSSGGRTRRPSSGTRRRSPSSGSSSGGSSGGA